MTRQKIYLAVESKNSFVNVNFLNFSFMPHKIVKIGWREDKTVKMSTLKLLCHDKPLGTDINPIQIHIVIILLSFAD